MASTFRLTRLCALAALVTATSPAANAQVRTPQNGTPALPSADAVVVDSFDSVAQWRTNPADGVEIAIHPDSGPLRNGDGNEIKYNRLASPE